MTAILRLESRRYIRSSVVLSVIFAILAAFYFSLYPGFADDAEALSEAFPDFMFEFFGIEAIHTIEGFIAAEIYSFFWVVLLAAYFAYLGGGMIAGDIRSRTMDLTLSNPVSRESVLLQKMGGLWLPLALLNLVIPVIVLAGAAAIGELMNPVAVFMLHILSIPYLLVCAAIGLVLSALIQRVRTARVTAFGTVIILWMVDGFSSMDPDLEWVGYLTPSRYYDVTGIIVHEEYAIVDAAILTVVFLLLLGIATMVFVRRDI